MFNGTFRFSIVWVIAIGCLSLAACFAERSPSDEASAYSATRAFQTRLSDVQVRDEGTVTRILPDDKQGSRHQRFILRLDSGQTVLIQHNIDLAPRVAVIAVGDTIQFFGDYVWNEQGGLVHWNHDPRGSRPGGWISHNGQKYE